MASAPPRQTSDPERAYARLTGMVDPNAPKEEMEAAIASSFADVPGYEQAYKESVKLNGVWYDLVGGYGGPQASFHGLMAKRESPSSYGMGSMAELGNARIQTPAMPSMPSMVRPPIAPLPNVARAAYAPLAGARPMSDLAVPEF